MTTFVTRLDELGDRHTIQGDETMKVPTSEGFLLNLEAPTVAAYEVVNRSHLGWFMWCTHCRHWHIHGPGEGHREAHCHDNMSPYYRHGYNLALAGKLTREEIEACEKSGRGPRE